MQRPNTAESASFPTVCRPQATQALTRERDERDGFDDLRQFTTTPLYFWTASVATVVELASRSYPLQEDAFLPTVPHAFCVFERPILWAVTDGVRTGLSALTWMSGIDGATGVLKLRIRGLVWTGARSSVCFSLEVTNPLRMPTNADPIFEQEARLCIAGSVPRRCSLNNELRRTKLSASASMSLGGRRS